VPTRHPQQVSSDSIFKKCADSTRLSTRVRCDCTCIREHTTDDCVTLPWLEELKTVSATALPDSEASLERQPQEALSPSTSDVTPTSTCNRFTLLVSIPCSNISHLNVLSISVQCPHVHNTLGWVEVLSIICSASSWRRCWHWQREVLCENAADDVEHATSLKITLTVFSQLVPN